MRVTRTVRYAGRGPRRLRRGLAVFAAAVLGAGCLSLDSRVDWEDGTDFAAYRTFSVERARPMEGEGQRFEDASWADLVDRRAFARIRQRLSEKGLREAPPAEADLNVSYYVTSREEVRGSSKPGHVRWLRVDIREIQYETYVHGSVVVDFADRAQGVLVWHGVVEGTVVASRTPGNNLEKAIDRLIGKYPPRWRKY